VERRPLVLRPLRERDFALLYTGVAVSLLGDGITLVALAWQVYDISNTPSALSIVGFAWALPMVAFVLFGGLLADRIPRRRLLIAADLIRCASLAGIGLLSVTGEIELWHVVALAVPYGVGQALFAPAYEASIPEIVPRTLLVQANSLYSLTEPISFRFAGPALGGLLVAGVGAGWAFLADAATFAFSAVCVSLMRQRPAPSTRPMMAVRQEIAEGFCFVRSQAWLWATLGAAAIGLLLFYGPFEVLLPYLIRNDFGAGAGGFGLVLAATGIGAIAASLALGQRGLARNHVLWMFCGWSAALGSLALFPLTEVLAVAMAVGLFSGVCFAIGNITWSTLIQSHVPGEMLGRVSSLDWLVSFGLVPISFALAGPAAEAFGVAETMIGAGVLAAIVFLAFLLVPGVREPERWAAADRPHEASVP
jgi:DHA3 family tetracycline resistance protein-like MFS transporter